MEKNKLFLMGVWLLLICVLSAPFILLLQDKYSSKLGWSAIIFPILLYLCILPLSILSLAIILVALFSKKRTEINPKKEIYSQDGSILSNIISWLSSQQNGTITNIIAWFFIISGVFSFLFRSSIYLLSTPMRIARAIEHIGDLIPVLFGVLILKKKKIGWWLMLAFLSLTLFSAFCVVYFNIFPPNFLIFSILSDTFSIFFIYLRHILAVVLIAFLIDRKNFFKIAE